MRQKNPKIREFELEESWTRKVQSTPLLKEFHDKGEEEKMLKRKGRMAVEESQQGLAKKAKTWSKDGTKEKQSLKRKSQMADEGSGVDKSQQSWHVWLASKGPGKQSARILQGRGSRPPESEKKTITEDEDQEGREGWLSKGPGKQQSARILQGRGSRPPESETKTITEDENEDQEGRDGWLVMDNLPDLLYELRNFFVHAPELLVDIEKVLEIDDMTDIVYLIEFFFPFALPKLVDLVRFFRHIMQFNKMFETYAER